MKKIVWPICLVLVLLTACQSNEVKQPPKKKSCAITQKKPTQTETVSTTFSYPQLLPTKSGHYSLLAVGTMDEKSPIEKNKKVVKGVHEILSLPLDQAKKIYPKLQLSNDPTYILFDKSGIVHQANNIKSLTQFLETNPAKQ